MPTQNCPLHTAPTRGWSPGVFASVIVVLLLAGSAAQAQEGVRKDVLLIDRMEKTAHHSVPANGLTMDQVTNQFGEPANRYGAVGDPPITRWVYDSFTVYFEYQRVIHAVINRATDTEKPGQLQG